MDHYHRAKQELFIFPLAKSNPMAMQANIPQLIEEHQEARNHIAHMRAAVDKGDTGEASKSTSPWSGTCSII
jgi:hemerythrin-like domain-containing protein